MILLFVDPNDHKAEISAFLTEKTGRTVSIQDDIGYTLYPWLGLDLGKMSVGNAPGFEEPLFAQIDQAKVRVKLIPLLTTNTLK
ncbi:AsmA [Beggiatoa sp. PS]|nr:AsmA [Beggiatoa sp. PS]